MSKQQSLINDIGRLYQGKVCYYFSDEWSLHELLAYLLEQTGKADVLISSYSVSEASIREFLRLKESGLINSIRCLLDLTVKAHKGGILYFANNVADEIRLTANHSKLILIESETLCVTVLTSANFTVNPRYESGSITTDKEVFQFFKNKVLTAFEKALPLIYD